MRRFMPSAGLLLVMLGWPVNAEAVGIREATPTRPPGLTCSRNGPLPGPIHTRFAQSKVVVTDPKEHEVGRLAGS